MAQDPEVFSSGDPECTARHDGRPEELDALQARALALAVRHVNASTPIAIPDGVMLIALRTGVIPAGFSHHVSALPDETDTATLADLVISEAVRDSELADLADALLYEGHPTRAWLNSRR